MRMMNAGKNVKLSEKELDKLVKRFDELDELKDLTAESLGRKSEMVFIQDHVCNANLKFQEDKMDGVKMTNPKSGKTIIAKS